MPSKNSIPYISHSNLILPLKKKAYFVDICCFSSAPSAECPPAGVHSGAGPACQPGVRGRRAAPAWGDLAQGEEARGVQRSHTHPGQRNSGHRLHPAQWRGLVHVYCQKPRRQSQPRHKARHSRWVEGGNVHKRLRAWKKPSGRVAVKRQQTGDLTSVKFTKSRLQRVTRVSLRSQCVSRLAAVLTHF